MKVIDLKIDNVKLILPEYFEDERGYFTESFSLIKFKQVTKLDNIFIQDCHSMSNKAGTLRGIHFQLNPCPQSKLVRCTKGAILDVVVDLKINSPTYKKHILTKLTSENRQQLFVPNGFGHGFLTLLDDTEVQYKVDEFYNSELDRAIAWDDPELNIEWGIKKPILSNKDMNAPLLKDSDVNFSMSQNY